MVYSAGWRAHESSAKEAVNSHSHSPLDWVGLKWAQSTALAGELLLSGRYTAFSSRRRFGEHSGHALPSRPAVPRRAHIPVGVLHSFYLSPYLLGSLLFVCGTDITVIMKELCGRVTVGEEPKTHTNALYLLAVCDSFVQIFAFI